MASGLAYTQSGRKQGFNKNVSSSKIGFRVALSNFTKEVIKLLPNKKWKLE